MKPKDVSFAVNLIWMSIAWGALSSLAMRWSGAKEMGQFIAELVVLGLSGVVPYKISKGSNGMRIAYGVLCAIGLLWMLGGGLENQSRLKSVMDLLGLPLMFASIYYLFVSDESKRWFAG